MTAEGTDAALSYRVDMVSLTPQDAVNIEISTLEVEMKSGETLQLTAGVIPGYADDISIRWMSSDVSVASVDGDGLVTAVAPGSCSIVCEDCAGHQDLCVLTVLE